MEINECFWCEEIIQNNKKSVKLTFIGKKDPLVISFHFKHYGHFSYWLKKKTKCEKGNKFIDFFKLSLKERNEEEIAAIEQGLGADFKKDRYLVNNILLHESIERTLWEENFCPVTKEMIELWACVSCEIQGCPIEREYQFSILLEE